VGDIEDIRPYVELAAVAVGAVAGALHAQRRGFDLVGVVVIGLIGGLGGGLIRDVLLGSGPVLALRSPVFLVTALVAAPLGIVFGTLVSRLAKLIWAVDSLALGLFTVAGLQRAHAAGLGLLPSLLLGVVTGVGGGVVRDVLCRETPVLLLPGVPYTPAAVVAGIVYLSAMRWLEFPPLKAELLAIGAAFGFRSLATWRSWRLPMPPDLPGSLLQRYRRRRVG
jgi:uncharacterized membrane protein YeiH